MVRGLGYYGPGIPEWAFGKEYEVYDLRRSCGVETMRYGHQREWARDGFPSASCKDFRMSCQDRSTGIFFCAIHTSFTRRIMVFQSSTIAYIANVASTRSNHHCRK